MMGHAFPEIKQKGELVKTVIRSEEESFGRTLDRGLEIFADAAEKAKPQVLSAAKMLFSFMILSAFRSI